jgi:hypothetical protein
MAVTSTKANIRGRLPTYKVQRPLLYLLDVRIPLTERILALLAEFARKEDRRVQMSRGLMARCCLGSAEEADMYKVKESVRSLERRNLIKLVGDDSAPKGGGTYRDYVHTYELVAPEVEPERLTVALAALNSYGKLKQYVRQEDYVPLDRSAAVERTSGSFEVPDALVPMALVRHPSFRAVFEPTKDARSTWNSIGKALNPAEIGLLCGASAIYFQRRSTLGGQKIKSPGGVLNGLFRRTLAWRLAKKEGCPQGVPEELWSAVATVKVPTEPNAQWVRLRDCVMGTEGGTG